MEMAKTESDSEKCSPQVDFELDTKYCIFCMRKCDNKEKTNNSKNFNNYYSINVKLQMFLKLLQRYVDSTKLRFPFIEEVSHFESCADCFLILQEFHDFYEQINLLEIKLSWKLRMLLAIMTSADKVSSRKNELRKFSNSILNGREHLLILRRFRNEFIKITSTKLKSSFPKVRLRRHEVQNEDVSRIKCPVLNSSSEVTKSEMPNDEHLTNSVSILDISEPFLQKQESTLDFSGPNCQNQNKFVITTEQITSQLKIDRNADTDSVNSHIPNDGNMSDATGNESAIPGTNKAEDINANDIHDLSLAESVTSPSSSSQMHSVEAVGLSDNTNFENVTLPKPIVEVMQSCSSDVNINTVLNEEIEEDVGFENNFENKDDDCEKFHRGTDECSDIEGERNQDNFDESHFLEEGHLPVEKDSPETKPIAESNSASHFHLVLNESISLSQPIPDNEDERTDIREDDSVEEQVELRRSKRITKKIREVEARKESRGKQERVKGNGDAEKKICFNGTINSNDNDIDDEKSVDASDADWLPESDSDQDFIIGIQTQRRSQVKRKANVRPVNGSTKWQKLTDDTVTPKSKWRREILRSKLEPPILQQIALKKLMSLKYTCNLPPCKSVTFWNIEDYKSHSEHHGEFHCNFCDVVVNYAPDLWKHEFQKHSCKSENSIKSKKGRRCPRCNVTSVTAQGLATHFLTAHMNLVTDRNTCSICKLTLRHTLSLTLPFIISKHFRTHHDYFTDNSSPTEGDMKIICDGDNCLAFFKTENQLLAHRRIHATPSIKPPPPSQQPPNHRVRRCPKFLENQNKNRRKLRNNLIAILKSRGITLSPQTELHFKNPKICRIKNCGKTFYDSKELLVHSELHGRFQCNFCTKTFDYAGNLPFHEMKHVKNQNLSENEDEKWMTISCPRCLFTTKRKNCLIPHFIETHLNLETDYHHCPICTRKIYCPHHTQKSGYQRPLRQHLETHDLSRKVHKCNEIGCPAYFSNIQQLRSHMYEHKLSVNLDSKNEKKWECKICMKTSKTRQGLASHLMKFHSEEMKKNREEDVHICEECGLSCDTLLGLKSHIARKHRSIKTKCDRKTYVCDLCGKSFKDNVRLEHHIYSHTGPDSWKFVCDTCNKRCMTKQKLEEHMRTHTKEKLFSCEHCGISYAHRHNLRNHINSKHGDIANDIPRKFDTSRLPSKKGIKLKNPEDKSTKTKTRRRVSKKRAPTPESPSSFNNSDSD